MLHAGTMDRTVKEGRVLPGSIVFRKG